MNRKSINQVVCSALVTVILGLASWQYADACSRILWNDNKLAVVVGRTMDWPESTEPILTVFPRGLKRNGGRLGAVEVIKDNPLTWTSQYGSLVTTIYGVGTADGFNERGLAAHMLFLNAADFGPRDPGKPGVNGGPWAQYLLDKAATVSEALALLDKVQIVMTETISSCREKSQESSGKL
jgi:penicillin V acylase-like amidase (Ntn superfamily)